MECKSGCTGIRGSGSGLRVKGLEVRVKEG